MTPAKFDRANPCTKVHLWNAFGGGKPTPVVVAQSIVGVNAPKYLLKQGYVKVISHNQTDLYEVSPAGQKWLLDGVKRHLELHPSDAAHLTRAVPGTKKPLVSGNSPRVVRRR